MTINFKYRGANQLCLKRLNFLLEFGPSEKRSNGVAVLHCEVQKLSARTKNKR